MSAGYKANMAAAGESDGRLEQRLQQNSSAFSALSLDNAVAAMPRLQVMPVPCQPSSLCSVHACRQAMICPHI